MHTTGRILDQDIKNLIDRCDIALEIGEHIKLAKKGKYLWGLCPFHEEKTPSFKVDPETQLYYCFGCNEGGNIFTFLSKAQNLNFIEAVEYLAKKHGVQLRRSASQAKRYNKLQRLYNINEEARKFFFAYLHSDYAKEPLDYLKKRNLSIEIIKTFDLGFAPKTGVSLVNYLTKQGFSYEEMIAAGLAKPFNSKAHDFFTGRLIFPIRDIQGRVVAFGGRTLSTGPKYINTRETDIYVKNSILYALFQAKKAIADIGKVIVVEGYTDVIALHMAGINNAVATLGTALTVNHLKLMNRFAEKIILVFDGDIAGLSAAERVLNLETDPQNISVVSLPQNLDPADFVFRKGADEFNGLVKNARPLIEFCIDVTISRHQLNSRQDKLAAAKAALKILNNLKDPLLFGEYRKLLAEKLRLDESSIIIQNNAAQKGRGQRRAEPVLPTHDAGEKAQKEMLKLILQSNDCQKYLDFLENDDFSNNTFKKVFTVLKNNRRGMKVNELLSIGENDDDTRNTITRLAVEPIERTDAIEKYSFGLYNKLRELSLERKISELKQMLQKMNPLKEIEYNKTFEQLIELEAQKRDLFSSIGG